MGQQLLQARIRPGRQLGQDVHEIGQASCPLSLADSIKLIKVAARSPACWLPTNSQLLRSRAIGRMAFSTALLSTGMRAPVGAPSTPPSGAACSPSPWPSRLH
jgi:hypothetical protein